MEAAASTWYCCVPHDNLGCRRANASTTPDIISFRLTDICHLDLLSFSAKLEHWLAFMAKAMFAQCLSGHQYALTWSPNQPLVPTQYLSPIVIRLSHVLCRVQSWKLILVWILLLQQLCHLLRTFWMVESDLGVVTTVRTEIQLLQIRAACHTCLHWRAFAALCISILLCIIYCTFHRYRSVLASTANAWLVNLFLQKPLQYNNSKRHARTRKNGMLVVNSSKCMVTWGTKGFSGSPDKYFRRLADKGGPWRTENQASLFVKYTYVQLTTHKYHPCQSRNL